jgi:hypothetical protein
MMAGDELFAELPTQAAPRSDTVGCGAPRLREPNRAQIELRAVDIDSLIGQDDPVRVIWSYVEDLDLSALEAPDQGARAQPRSSEHCAAASAGAVAVRHPRRHRQRAGAATTVRAP